MTKCSLSDEKKRTLKTTRMPNIIENAEREARLEKLKVKDETRTEIISVAYAMAGKILDENIDTAKQEQLLEETLEEIGEDTWQSE